jgi:hypothetical protein
MEEVAFELARHKLTRFGVDLESCMIGWTSPPATIEWE